MPDRRETDQLEADRIARAQQGDVRAFEDLVHAHLPTIRRFAFAFTGSWADADDCAQDAIVKAYGAIRGYRGDAAFSTWLFRITRNACIDAGRGRLGTQRASESPIDDAATFASDEPSQDANLAARQDRDRLWHAVRALDPPFRTVLVLFDIEGLAYDEIAAAEGLPIGTVRSRLFRARERLARLLGESEGTFPAQASSSLKGAP